MSPNADTWPCLANKVTGAQPQGIWRRSMTKTELNTPNTLEKVMDRGTDGSHGDGKGDMKEYLTIAGMSQLMDDQEESWFTLTLDSEGRVFSVSKTFDRFFHRPSSDLIGKPFRELVEKADWGSVEEALRSLGSGPEENRRARAQLRLAGDAPVPFELSFAQLTDGTATIGVNVLAKLSHPFLPLRGNEISKQLTEDLMSSAQLSVIALDTEGKVLAVSRVTESELGYERADLVGKRLAELLVTDRLSEDELVRLIAMTLEGGRPTANIPLRKRDGTTVEFAWRLMPLGGEGGKTMGVLCVGHDTLMLRPMEGEAEDIQTLEVLAETSTDLVESDDLADTIDRDLDKLIESLGIEYAVFRLMGVESKPRLVCAGVDFKVARKLLESRVVGSGQLYRTVQEGKPFISLDLRSDPRIVIEELDIRSLACLPIKFKKEIFGCAVFASSRLNGITQNKLPILQVFSNQVAISVRKARLKRELHLRNKEREILYETSMAISGTLGYPKILSTILSKAGELVKSDNAYLFTLDKKTRRLKCIAHMCEYPEAVEGLELKLGEGITGLVAQTGKGILVERADKDQRSKLVEGTPDEPSSLISVPLKMGDDVLGVVTLERVPGSPFTSADYSLIEMFSVQAATAVNNAVMFNRINEHASAQQMYTILLTHDVANYNVPIHGYLEMLAKDPKLDDRQRKFVLSALAQSENISSLIADVRKLTLLRSLESSKDFQTMDLVKTVQECVDSLRMNTLYEEIEIRFPAPQQSVLVQGDAFVKDVVYNLLSNACKYGGRAPIDVEVRPHEEKEMTFWRLDVKDRGEGVSPERKAFLFKRFDQFDVESAAEGHGIGLSVVAALSERFGGRVWVEDRESVDQIKGSMFSVIFPQVKV